MPILCAKDRRNKFLWAFMLPEKGAHDYNVRVLKDIVLETGYKRLQLKSDGEPAIVALKTSAIEQLPGVEVMPQEAPRGDHQANG